MTDPKCPVCSKWIIDPYINKIPCPDCGKTVQQWYEIVRERERQAALDELTDQAQEMGLYSFPFGPIPHWVNMDDEKPKPFMPVLLAGKEWIGYGVYRPDGDYFVMHPIIAEVKEKGLATHWMPLPEPPNE